MKFLAGMVYFIGLGFAVLFFWGTCISVLGGGSAKGFFYAIGVLVITFIIHSYIEPKDS